MPSLAPLRFIDLFAGLGGFHQALAADGHECVFASELDDELRHVYSTNHAIRPALVAGDIADSWEDVPEHDILCAGFPCQPFSKSGSQLGLADVTRGTLFDYIARIIRIRSPSLVLLENVGNFARHDNGRTWRITRDTLESLGYHVRGTEHKTDGGHGLISPHHFGHPHHRERFFVVAARWPLPPDPFPRSRARPTAVALESLLDDPRDLTVEEASETALSPQQVACIDLWNEFLRRVPRDIELPSFPIWGDEIGATYPFEEETPWELTRTALQDVLGPSHGRDRSRAALLGILPSYARAPGPFPPWKKRFIRSNRQWFDSLNGAVTDPWLQELKSLPASLRKLEWNCKGGERDLWTKVLQFRPSGLRAKRFDTVPALVAMTTTQVPILGPRRRYITRREGLRLQGFPVSFRLPSSRAGAFRALGNAVHVDVVRRISRSAISTAAA